eukprot:scaffold3457_cov230-Pinguiococcus_pyrenoidosus.AAC.9
MTDMARLLQAQPARTSHTSHKRATSCLRGSPQSNTPTRFSADSERTQREGQLAPRADPIAPFSHCFRACVQSAFAPTPFQTEAERKLRPRGSQSREGIASLLG